MDTSKMQRKAQKSMDGVAGLRGAGVKDLSYKMVFIASSVHTGDTRFAFNQGSYAADDEEAEKDINKMFTMQERHEVTRMKQEDNLYQKLAKSIAPSVYGHLDIKKGILLQIFGGIQKKTKEGIKLRGDINICIVGDPATAKSQFLKYICSFISFLIFK
jgi:DNA replication licensing factor MCM6